MESELPFPGRLSASPRPGIKLIHGHTAAQWIGLGCGLGLWVLLWVTPGAGLMLFWNVLIPAAPALIVLAAGLWRNVCPLATFALLPGKLGRSRRSRVPPVWQGRLQLVSVLLLFLIVPLRHLWFDMSGTGTALLLAAAGLIAAGSGCLFELKAVWCSGLCPVHPVERLYGSRPALTVTNNRCLKCAGCSVTCPDSTVNLTPFSGARSPAHKAAALLLTGGFPGFIAGWSLVPDVQGTPASGEWLQAFWLPSGGMLLSLAIFASLEWINPSPSAAARRRLTFATAAVVIYYWFRLPALIGFGIFPADGRLMDLSQTLPGFTPWLLRACSTAFFVWWLLLRKETPRAWSPRPLRKDLH